MKRVAIVCLVVVGIVAGVWWFLANFEIQEETRRVPPSARARRNPLLALERFFGEVGMTTSTHQTLVGLPPKDQVLILVAPRRFLGIRRSMQLLEWVEGGGHMVLSPQRRDRWSDEEDHLLQTVGISANFSGAGEEAEDDDDDDLWSYRSPTRSPAATARARFVVRFPGVDKPLWMARYSPVMLVDDHGEATFTLKDERGRAHVLHRPYGRGFVTVIAERAFLTNQKVGENDHARVAWELIHLGLAPAGVRIVLSDDMPGIASLLVRNAWPVLWAGLLLLGLWLWHVGGRLGPKEVEPEPTRRSLEEHLQAAGSFLWRQRASGPLLAAVRRRLRTRLQTRHPELARATPEEAVPVLAQWSEIPDDRLQAALLPETIADPRAFTQAVRDLQTLLQRL